MAATKLTYKVYTATEQLDAARSVLHNAEQQHYIWSLADPAKDGTLEARLEAQVEEIKRLQKVYTEAEKASNAEEAAKPAPDVNGEA